MRDPKGAARTARPMPRGGSLLLRGILAEMIAMATPTPGSARGATCGTPGPTETLLDAAGFDGFERHTLDVMRLIFADQSGTRPRHGAGPADVADRLFGADHGPVLLVAITALVQTMAIARSEPFRYSNPYCAGCARVLTRHEALLLRVLHLVRRGRTGAATIEALMLCDSRPVAALLEAADDLAALAICNERGLAGARPAG